MARLPSPIADVWDGQYEGACRQVAPRVFFYPEGERGPARRDRDAAAVAVCATCPVIQSCRTHALLVREPYEVWGALTTDEREPIHASQRAERNTALALACL